MQRLSKRNIRRSVKKYGVHGMPCGKGINALSPHSFSSILLYLLLFSSFYEHFSRFPSLSTNRQLELQVARHAHMA